MSYSHVFLNPEQADKSFQTLVKMQMVMLQVLVRAWNLFLLGSYFV